MTPGGYSGFKSTLARLSTLIAMKHALVRADPLPFLVEAHARMLELELALREVEAALCDTNWVYDRAAAINTTPDLYKADTERVSRARRIISTYLTRSRSNAQAQTPPA